MVRPADIGSATLLGVLLLGAAGGAAAVEFVTPRNLAFMQARGGIALGEPVRGDRGWRLPLACDVSGVSSVNRPGNLLHAGVAWWRSVAAIESGRIYLTIETEVQGPDAPSARCGPAELGELADGDYEVFYRDPDGSVTRLGEVRVGR